VIYIEDGRGDRKVSRPFFAARASARRHRVAPAEYFH
jgi:hypothetical protein